MTITSTTALTPYTYTHTRPPAERSFSTTSSAKYPRVSPGTIIPRPPPSVSPRIQRPEWQMHPATPLYELPLSVIDLDAIDNPNVRPYDEEFDGYYEKQKWAKAHASIDALAERLAQTEKQIEAARLRMKVMESQRTPWQVLDKDVWAAVLNVREPGHGNVLHHNGISARLAATPQKVPLLLNRALVARERQDMTKTADLLMEALTKSRTPIEVRRIVSLAVQTAGGRAAAIQCSEAIAHKLVSFIETQEWSKYKEKDERGTASQVTAMLLNWSYALRLEGEQNLGKATSLWALGMWTAALTNNITAMQRFLQVGLGQGTAEDCKRLLSTYTSTAAKDAGAWPAAALALDMVLDRMRDTPATLDGTRAELFSLVTGVNLLRPAPDAGPEVSFRVLLERLPSHAPYSHLYTSALAELGAVRTLWEVVDKTQATLDADIIVAVALRYAAYLETVTETPGLTAMAGSVPPTATTGLDKSSANSSIWDLQTIVNSETQRTMTRQPPTLFPTLRPLPRELEKRTHLIVDDAFRAEVVAAFSKSSAEEAVKAIYVLLQKRIDSSSRLDSGESGASMTSDS
ncbi:aldehyde dehydrogenase (NADP(+)) ald6 [Sporothrix stenoceras]|uniref:Aldehyde dehydrogenase (NADP(+)) ald6 n=1 Tax=Sporothrix stenoceras TaxID=5173 RepID=A0ABR3ZJU4_9PEZI